MGPVLLSLLAGASAAWYAYGKISRTNGGADSRKNAIAATIIGVLVAIIFFTVSNAVL